MTRSSRPFTTRRVLAAAVLAGVALTASGCGGGGIDAGAAAVVGDRRVSVADVQTATTQVNQIIDPQGTNADQRFDQRTVLSLLMTEPFVVAAAAANGVGVSEAEARQTFAQFNFKDPVTGSRTPSQASLDLVRSILAFNLLQGRTRAEGETPLPAEKGQAAFAEVAKQLQATDIAVNPRYGTFEPVFDVQAQKIFPITASSPNWLVPTAQPQPTPSQTPTP